MKYKLYWAEDNFPSFVEKTRMKKLNYSGFGGIPSMCEYGIGSIGGKKAVVFLQTTSGGTSITNVIEVLTMHVLATDLPGVDPSQVRVFEHYAPTLKPLFEWKEVLFSDVGEIQDEKNIARKLIELVVPSGAPKKWYVDGPSWQTVAATELAIVSAIL